MNYFCLFVAGNEEEEGLLAVKKIQKECGHRKGMFAQYVSESALSGNKQNLH